MSSVSKEKGSFVTRFRGAAAERLAVLFAAAVDKEADLGGDESGPYEKLYNNFVQSEINGEANAAAMGRFLGANRVERIQAPAHLGISAAAAGLRQVGGTHYQGIAMDPWAVARAWGFGVWRHGVLKYIQRSQKKNGKQDLEKARHYLDYLIENYDALIAEGVAL